MKPKPPFSKREAMDRAIRAAHRLGQVWEPHFMPLRVPSMTEASIRKRKSLEKK